MNSVTYEQSRALSISHASTPRRVALADQRMNAAIGKIRKFIRSYITIILLTDALFHAHLILRVLFAHDDPVALQLNTARIGYYFNKQKLMYVLNRITTRI